MTGCRRISENAAATISARQDPAQARRLFAQARRLMAVPRRDLMVQIGATLAGLPTLAQGANKPAPGAYSPNTYAPQHLHFGDQFSFGVSSSAYQIEGATRIDGRGEGIWDAFCLTLGGISTHETAAVACDHYHRMPADIALIAAAGIRNYRFSVSWPRLFPDGGGQANAAGFAFYDRLLDHLHQHGIAPWLCLYHWDLPQALQASGGWTNRDTAFRFADFCEQLSKHFGDRVSHWMAMNEIATHSMLGYGVGTHAPGEQGALSWVSALHHLNLGQGLGIQALRAANVAGRIGTIACCEPIRPASDSDADAQAASLFDGMWNGAVLAPLYHGRYPEIVAAFFEPFCKNNDMADIQQKIDLLGVNYYSRLYIQADPGSPMGIYFGPSHLPRTYTAMGWPIEPDGLHEALMHVTQTYGAPEIFISENGFATVDKTVAADTVNDYGRVEFISDHLNFLHLAVANGARVSGYFVWALMDSFEWNDGTKWRFGLVAIDFETLQRTPKLSYHWYAELISHNAAIRL